MIGITRPCTKWNTLVKDVRDIPRAINEAFVSGEILRAALCMSPADALLLQRLAFLGLASFLPCRQQNNHTAAFVAAE